MMTIMTAPSNSNWTASTDGRTMWMNVQPAICFAVFVMLHLSSGAVTRNYDIVFEGIEDEQINYEYFGPTSGMHLKRFNRTSLPTLYDTVDIIKPLPNSTIVEAVVFERRDNKYVRSFLNYRMNLCDYLAKERKPIIKDFREVFGFPSSCPLVGLFKLENFKVRDEILPPVLPGPEHWKIFFALHKADKTNLIQHSVVFLVDRSKAIRKKGSKQ